jgi:hypothetical protein
MMHTKLKRDVLQGWLEHVYLPPEERQQKEQLLAEVEAKLAVAGEKAESAAYYWDM